MKYISWLYYIIIFLHYYSRLTGKYSIDTILDDSVQTNDGIWVLNKSKYSVFSQYFGKYTKETSCYKVVSHVLKFRLDLASFLGSARYWVQFQGIFHLTFRSPP